MQLDNIHQMGEIWGHTQKAFKSLDESPGSNEPGFLARDFCYSWLISCPLRKVSNFCLFPPITIKVKRTGTSQENHLSSWFSSGFCKWNNYDCEHYTPILYISIYQMSLSKGSFCGKSIRKNYFLHLFY
jgi:hypothetical protein